MREIKEIKTVCSTCNGNGEFVLEEFFFPIKATCLTCNGEGYEKRFTEHGVKNCPIGGCGNCSLLLEPKTEVEDA